jgi:hypothetical protein
MSTSEQKVVQYLGETPAGETAQQEPTLCTAQTQRSL